jgi:glycosyltransferase involved in cell wall biosynthesis
VEKKNKKSILYIAFHYPPIVGSTGVHRSLAFTRYLSQKKWQVNVLTASVKAYDKWSADQYAFIPKSIRVIRAYARDVAKSYAIGGKYFSFMAQPDSWQSWIPAAIVRGYCSIKKNNTSIIISTYPIASAHIIAYALQKMTKVAWIADFRDPMAQENYPSSPTKKKIFLWLEKKIIKHCRYALVTTAGAKTYYLSKYPQTADDFWQVIPNGYDEQIFTDVESEATPSDEKQNDKLTLLHSGVVYPSERDPSQLFQAIAELKLSGHISTDSFSLRLRATGHDNLYQARLVELGIDDIVELAPPIPYKNALAEMLNADALLLLQASNCNYQIPAKAYEYIRSARPVLALTDPAGDTAKLLLEADTGLIAPLNDTVLIKDKIMQLIDDVQNDIIQPVSPEVIRQYSRDYQAIKLESLLDKMIE